MNLEKLDMRDNALNEFPETVCSLTSLKELNIQGCLLKDLPARYMYIHIYLYIHFIEVADQERM